MTRYIVDRFDNMGRSKRDELLACCPGWEPKANTPQFFIVDTSTDQPADWPLIDSIEEAFRDCREFNEDDDSDARSEARGLAMMSGDLSFSA